MNAALAAHFLVLLLGAALKASLAFALVYAAAFLLRDSLPAQRHLLWFAVIASYFLILLFSFIGPQWLPVLEAGAASPGGAYGTVSALLLAPGGVTSPTGSLPTAVARRALGEPAWAFPLLLLWVGGALASMVNVAAGGVRLLAVEARRRGGHGAASRHEARCRELAAAVGLRRRIRVVDSQACRVPCASGILRPLIMLPAAASAWPDARLRAVLLHELRHVQRLDFLTQALARWICSLFWFVPFTWIAYSFLYAEQEKACDASVLEHGVARSDYAACLLQVAHHEPQPAPFAGLYSPTWRKRILMDRIRRILEGGRGVKKKWIVFALTVSVVGAIVALGCSGGKEPLAKLSDEEAYKRFVGRWVNTDYPGTLEFTQVTVIRPDYVGEDWAFPKSTVAMGEWTIRIRKIWVDEKGNIYIQSYNTRTKPEEMKHSIAALMRVDKKGKVWECVVKPFSQMRAPSFEEAVYPEKIDPSLRYYWIYYRKE